MYFSSFSLKNFRSFKDVDIEEISPTLSVITAPNATGKTNFLEALYITLRGKSFRASHEECVRWGEELFVLQAKITDNGEDTRIATQYHIPSRKLRIEKNREPVSPVALYTAFPVVLFLPDDTFLFLRGPSMRRNFLNQALSSSPSYLSAVVQYSRVLKQRNTALKTATQAQDIENWTSLLVEQGEVVWSTREMLVQFMNHRVPVIYKDLFGGSSSIELVFSKGVPDGVGLQEALHEAWDHERRYRYTLYGPHRDDVEVLIDGRPAQSSMSRGQMRMLVLAMKLSVLEFTRKTLNQSPIVLLDEVMSELDEGRQQRLLEHLPTSQVFLTATDVPSGVKNRSDARVLDLKKILEVSPPVNPKTSSVAVQQENQIEKRVHV